MSNIPGIRTEEGALERTEIAANTALVLPGTEGVGLVDSVYTESLSTVLHPENAVATNNSIPKFNLEIFMRFVFRIVTKPKSKAFLIT